MNADEILNLANNWDSLCEKYAISKAEEKAAEEAKRNLLERKEQFLQTHAKKIYKISKPPRK